MNTKNKEQFNNYTQSLNYEYPNFFSRLINFPTLIIMSILPYSLSKIIIKKSSKRAAHIHENVTTHSALDAVYDAKHFTTSKINIVTKIAEYLWFNLYNTKAVRNRLKLTSFFLEKSVQEISKKKKVIEIISLASGSSRAVINTILKFQDKNVFFNVKLLDKNNKALEISRELVKSSNLKNAKFEFINDKIRNFNNYYKNDFPDIVEMVGFLDYLDEDKSVKLISKIYKKLHSGGFLVIANIRKNSEKIFFDKALRWKMDYKEPNVFCKILTNSGFKKSNINIVYEPFKIHGVAKIKKN